MEFELIENTAVLRFDDGKANVIGHDFMGAMIEGLDRAEQEAKAVVITSNSKATLLRACAFHPGMKIVARRHAVPIRVAARCWRFMDQPKTQSPGRKVTCNPHTRDFVTPECNIRSNMNLR